MDQTALNATACWLSKQVLIHMDLTPASAQAQCKTGDYKTLPAHARKARALEDLDKLGRQRATRCCRTPLHSSIAARHRVSPLREPPRRASYIAREKHCSRASKACSPRRGAHPAAAALVPSNELSGAGCEAVQCSLAVSRDAGATAAAMAVVVSASKHMAKARHVSPCLACAAVRIPSCNCVGANACMRGLHGVQFMCLLALHAFALAHIVRP